MLFILSFLLIRYWFWTVTFSSCATKCWFVRQRVVKQFSQMSCTMCYSQFQFHSQCLSNFSFSKHHFVQSVISLRNNNKKMNPKFTQNLILFSTILFWYKKITDSTTRKPLNINIKRFNMKLKWFNKIWNSDWSWHLIIRKYWMSWEI